MLFYFNSILLVSLSLLLIFNVAILTIVSSSITCPDPSGNENESSTFASVAIENPLSHSLDFVLKMIFFGWLL